MLRIMPSISPTSFAPHSIRVPSGLRTWQSWSRSYFTRRALLRSLKGMRPQEPIRLSMFIMPTFSSVPP